MISVKVRGTSMMPAIRPGDSLHFDPDRAPKKGDVVLFREKGEFVAHRYLGENLLKGDNSKHFDHKEAQVLAVASSQYRSLFIATFSRFNLQGKLLSRPSRLIILLWAYLLRLFKNR